MAFTKHDFAPAWLTLNSQKARPGLTNRSVSVDDNETDRSSDNNQPGPVTTDKTALNAYGRRFSVEGSGQSSSSLGGSTGKFGRPSRSTSSDFSVGSNGGGTSNGGLTSSTGRDYKFASFNNSNNTSSISGIIGNSSTSTSGRQRSSYGPRSSYTSRLDSSESSSRTTGYDQDASTFDPTGRRGYGTRVTQPSSNGFLSKRERDWESLRGPSQDDRLYRRDYHSNSSGSDFNESLVNKPPYYRGGQSGGYSSGGRPPSGSGSYTGREDGGESSPHSARRPQTGSVGRRPGDEDNSKYRGWNRSFGSDSDRFYRDSSYEDEAQDEVFNNNNNNDDSMSHSNSNTTDSNRTDSGTVNDFNEEFPSLTTDEQSATAKVSASVWNNPLKGKGSSRHHLTRVGAIPSTERKLTGVNNDTSLVSSSNTSTVTPHTDSTITSDDIATSSGSSGATGSSPTTVPSLVNKHTAPHTNNSYMLKMLIPIAIPPNRKVNPPQPVKPSTSPALVIAKPKPAMTLPAASKDVLISVSTTTPSASTSTPTVRTAPIEVLAPRIVTPRNKKMSNKSNFLASLRGDVGNIDVEQLDGGEKKSMNGSNGLSCRDQDDEYLQHQHHHELNGKPNQDTDDSNSIDDIGEEINSGLSVMLGDIDMIDMKEVTQSLNNLMQCDSHDDTDSFDTGLVDDSSTPPNYWEDIDKHLRTDLSRSAPLRSYSPTHSSRGNHRISPNIPDETGGSITNTTPTEMRDDPVLQLSSSLEAEQRLLQEMGWQNLLADESAFAPITEEERREFESLKQRNGTQLRGLPDSCLKRNIINTYEDRQIYSSNESLSSSLSDPDDIL